MAPGGQFATTATTTAKRLAAAAPGLLAITWLLLFAALPVLLLVAQSFWGSDGPTLAAYAELLHDDGTLTRIWASARLGLAATAISLLLGGGHAWLCLGTDLPGGRWLLPLGVAPLVMPPIFVAMGYADLVRASGFWPCAVILGVAHAPFVAVLAARGLRQVDGRGYEAALIARGRAGAERLLLRSIRPELLAGCLLALLFTVADHGVPEFLTIKGKAWHTYAEGMFARWTRRAVGTTEQDLASPIAAAVPFVAVLAVLLYAALRLRGQPTHAGDLQPLPLRRLGRWRWPATLLPIVYLAAGLGAPALVMLRWAAGSAQAAEPMSLDFVRRSFAKAFEQGVPDLGNSLVLAIVTALVVGVLALPLARSMARRRPGLELLCALPVAVPAILLGIGLVRIWNGEAVHWFGAGAGRFYDGPAFALCGYTARFLPFAALALATQVRRIPLHGEEAALLAPRSRLARAWHIHLPPLLPSAWSAAILTYVLALRELDLAVMLPAANATAVRRLANAVHFQHEDWSGATALLLLAAAIVIPWLPVWVAGRKPAALS